MRFIRFLAATALLMLLGGCAPVPVSELYSLPKPPDEYVSLQELIDAEISGGSEYASPVRGSHRQSVQLYDLNSSGQDEALAFFRTAEGALKIVIYQSDAGVYTPACTISGEGSAIGRIEYADMDGDGTAELIAAWQMDGGITMLNVYSLRLWSGSVLLTADCSGWTCDDLDRDGNQELLALHCEPGAQGSLELYSLKGDGSVVSSSAQLSRGFDIAARMTAGNLSTGERALFVEGSYMDSHTITDVFISDGGEIRNITARQTGISPTTRSYAVYSDDINGDGVTELPSTRLLGTGDGAEYWAFDWHQVSADGRLTETLSTFHCYADGWYLELDGFGSRQLSICREDFSAGKCIVISAVDGDTLTPLAAVYTLTGENRHERAVQGGRIVLTEDSTAVYAMRLLSDELSADAIKESFHLIRSEWISPVL
ncbi:MAG: hypothetical protein ACOX81_08195 [Candidatus Heteroscillospira sp.]|jgi:hypothetical protein